LQELAGNLAGLKPSERKALERIYRRRISPDEIVSSELGVLLCDLSRTLARQIGVLISRRGDIEFVIVGDASRIFLPEVGRLRAGHGRFRGLRLVHTHLRNEPLSRDDLVDLALLRLDWIAALGTHPDGRPGDLYQAHLVPHHEGKSPWVLLPTVPFHRVTNDFRAQMAALEDEFDRVSPSTRATSERSQALLVVAEIGKRRGD
jgi:GTP-binding protein HflX